MSIYITRLEKLREQLREKSILILPAKSSLIRNRDTHYPYRADSDILYLTGINEEEFSIVVSREKIVFYARDRDPETERWTGRVTGHAVLKERFASIAGLEVKLASTFYSNLESELLNHEVLLYNPGEDMVLDHKFFSILAKYRNLSRKKKSAPRELQMASVLLSSMRRVKDSFEIEIMRQAAKISTTAHNVLREFIQSTPQSISEFQLKALIESEFMKAGADRLAYPTIVAAGENATVLHYEGSYGVAKVGDFILVDAGCELNGYASDITRTTGLGSSLSVLKNDLYQLTLQAQLSATHACRGGNTIDKIHELCVRELSRGLLELGLFNSVPKKFPKEQAAEKPAVLPLVKVSSLEEVIEHEYYSYYYMHRTSHYLGLDVHDVGDYYSREKAIPLEAGVVITIEPGLYFPSEYEFLSSEFKGIGIRIEDDILITDGDPENLTAAAVK